MIFFDHRRNCGAFRRSTRETTTLRISPCLRARCSRFCFAPSDPIIEDRYINLICLNKNLIDEVRVSLIDDQTPLEHDSPTANLQASPVGELLRRAYLDDSIEYADTGTRAPVSRNRLQQLKLRRLRRTAPPSVSRPVHRLLRHRRQATRLTRQLGLR